MFRPLTFVQDWFATYSALVESSFCLTCIYQMAEVPVEADSLPLREKRLGHDLRGLISDASEGIRAEPLDSSYYHWQASITGPVGSPYEGGIFYLYLKVRYFVVQKGKKIDNLLFLGPFRVPVRPSRGQVLD